VGLLLQVLVDRTSFVIGGVVAIAENTEYCIRPVLAVAIEGQMITGALFCTWMVQI
jgi:nitrate reductase NapE component